MENLTEAPRTTRTLSPATSGDQGVLYWLGTAKGTKSYSNPHDKGEVEVHRRALENYSPAEIKEQNRTFVQYQPELKSVTYRPESLWVSLDCHCAGRSPMDCDDGFKREDPLVITLQNIAVRATHYSLRFE